MAKSQVAEERRAQYTLNMLQVLADVFLPDVEACDEQGFADCLIDTDDGWNFNEWDFNADIFSHPCAEQYGCQNLES